MRITLALFKADIALLLRLPAYIVPTMCLPAILYLFVGAQAAKLSGMGSYMAASFAAFAVFGVVLFQFAVGIAKDREEPWSVYLRTLPTTPAATFIARIMTAMILACMAATIVIIVAFFASKVTFGPADLARLYFALIVGAIPLAILGIVLGYTASPKSALPIANIAYLVLAFGGGLLMPAQNLPTWMQNVSAYLPTFFWGSLVHSSALGQAWHDENWIWLAVYGVIFALIASWGYRRDEGARYK